MKIYYAQINDNGELHYMSLSNWTPKDIRDNRCWELIETPSPHWISAGTGRTILLMAENLAAAAQTLQSVLDQRKRESGKTTS